MAPEPGSSSHPYIPNTDADRSRMLQTIGITAVDELFANIPASFRDPTLNLPPALSEMELKRHLEEIAAKNDLSQLTSFLGGGTYRHFVPAIVDHIAADRRFLTAYTPYQAEASQGTLTAIYEYQSHISALTGMEIANAGMYDGASALAEGILMATRLTKRSRILTVDSTQPSSFDVVTTYTQGKDLNIIKVGSEAKDQVDDQTACVIVQSPNYFGHLEDIESWAKSAHDQGAQLVVYITNPLSLGLFKPPGELGADIVVGEAQSLGTPPIFGGPALGFLATKRERERIRQMPGRIVAQSQDAAGRTGYLLTLQTREQFIARERATSNITTNQNLIALRMVTFLSLLGPQGLKDLAKLNWDKAHYAAREIGRLRGFRVPDGGTFFNEFPVRCPSDPQVINRRLREQKLIGGIDISDQVENGMLICATEMHTKEQIDQLVERLAKAA